MIVSVKTNPNEIKIDIGIKRLLDNAPVLVEDLADTVKQSNEDNISDSKNFNGSKPPALTPKYKEWKAKNLGYTDIFQGKELKLIKSIKKEKVSNLHWKVFIDSERDDIVTYLEKQGRNPFGVGSKLKTELRQNTQEWIDDNING